MSNVKKWLFIVLLFSSFIVLGLYKIRDSLEVLGHIKGDSITIITEKSDTIKTKAIGLYDAFDTLRMAFGTNFGFLFLGKYGYEQNILNRQGLILQKWNNSIMTYGQSVILDTSGFIWALDSIKSSDLRANIAYINAILPLATSGDIFSSPIKMYKIYTDTISPFLNSRPYAPSMKITRLYVDTLFPDLITRPYAHSMDVSHLYTDTISSNIVSANIVSTPQLFVSDSFIDSGYAKIFQNLHVNYNWALYHDPLHPDYIPVGIIVYHGNSTFYDDIALVGDPLSNNQSFLSLTSPTDSLMIRFRHGTNIGIDVRKQFTTASRDTDSLFWDITRSGFHFTNYFAEHGQDTTAEIANGYIYARDSVKTNTVYPNAILFDSIDLKYGRKLKLGETSISMGLNSGRVDGFNNILFGDSAGFPGGGLSNTVVGYKAGPYLGDQNTIVGAFACGQKYSRSYVSAFGYMAGNAASGVNGGCFFGYLAGHTTTGQSNSFFGRQSGTVITTGPNNTMLGAFTRAKTATDTSSIVIGAFADGEGSYTTVLGRRDSTRTIYLWGSWKGASSTDSIMWDKNTGNLSITGKFTADSLYTGNLKINTTAEISNGYIYAKDSIKTNTVYPNAILFDSIDLKFGKKLKIGALSISMGLNSGTTANNYNTFFGDSAGYNNTVGIYNTSFGYKAGTGTNYGYNTVVGALACGINNNRSNVSAFGYMAGYTASGVNGSCLFGHSAGRYLTTGQWNSFFGIQSGYNMTTGPSNTILGAYADAKTATDTSSIVIGAFADGEGSYTTVLGRRDSTRTIYLWGSWKGASSTDSIMWDKNTGDLFITGKFTSDSLYTGNLKIDTIKGTANIYAGIKQFRIDSIISLTANAWTSIKFNVATSLRGDTLFTFPVGSDSTKIIIKKGGIYNITYNLNIKNTNTLAQTNFEGGIRLLKNNTEQASFNSGIFLATVGIGDGIPLSNDNNIIVSAGDTLILQYYVNLTGFAIKAPTTIFDNDFGGYLTITEIK